LPSGLSYQSDLMRESCHPPEAKRLYAESGEWGAGCSVTFPLRNIPGAPLGVTSFAWPGAAELLRSPASPT